NSPLCSRRSFRRRSLRLAAGGDFTDAVALGIRYDRSGKYAPGESKCQWVEEVVWDTALEALRSGSSASPPVCPAPTIALSSNTSKRKSAPFSSSSVTTAIPRRQRKSKEACSLTRARGCAAAANRDQRSSPETSPTACSSPP